MTWDVHAGGSEDLLGLRVLVVDDESVIALDLEQIFSSAGAQIVGPACSIPEALAYVDSEPISVALLDVRVGGEMVTPVATALAERDVPFVLYSGQVEGDAMLRRWPAAAFIAKPAPARVLIRALLDVAERNEARRAAADCGGDVREPAHVR